MHSVPRPRPSLSARLGLCLTATTVLLAGTVLAALAPSAQAIGFSKVFAGNCKVERCGIKSNGAGGEISEPSRAEDEANGFRVPGGYTPFGVTAFRMETEKLPHAFSTFGEQEAPVGFLSGGSARFIRTDVAPGVVTNPFAPGLGQCPTATFNGVEIEPENPVTQKPALFVYPPGGNCNVESTAIGRNRVRTMVEVPEGEVKFLPVNLEGIAYNLEQLTGFGSTYGVEVYTGVEVHLTGIPGLPTGNYKVYTHTIIEGNVEWASNYHDYFEIHKIPPGLIESRLIFYGNEGVESFGTQHPESTEITELSPNLEGERKFIRNPTSCNTSPSSTTTSVFAENSRPTPESASGSFTSKVGTGECEGAPPFANSVTFALTPENKGSDSPDGIKTETKVEHPTETTPDTADLKTAKITMPPGMTMNPSAAAGLEGCTEEQFGIHSRRANACPGGSRLGSVTLEVPTLPAGSLTGSLYLGKPASGPITAPPYTVWLDAESARYGVKVRLKGNVSPNPSTGQLETTFNENPEAPFNSLVVRFNGGAFAPIANPLNCGTATTEAAFLPFSNENGALALSPFTVEGCASPQFTAPPLSQSLTVVPKKGGSESNFVFTITRPQGQQFLSQMKTTLPPGLVAKIPSVPLCGETQANAGTCPSTSQVGVTQVAAGSGEPFKFNGRVYLTGPYQGSPYGLSIVTPTEAGPFNFGPITTRASINVNKTTAQVEVAIVKSFVQGGEVKGLPTIVGGIPTRIRSITVAITHPNYIINPTNCAALTGTTTLGSTLGASALVSSPFQVENCSSLAFSPKFTASTAGNKASRANGASLGVNISQGSGQANIGSVVTTLPKQLPSRLTTLQKACVLSTFETNPFACPKESNVGTVTAVTPTLPGTMKGPAYIVSRGAAFPDLELVLQGDGVTVILDGKTNIKNSITTTTFASNPDVPISSFSLNLPTGKFSLLAANGNLCKPKLVMPTTITGQNGKVNKQNTQIQASGCLPILKAKVKGHKVTITVKVPQAGRVRFSGEHMGIVTRFPNKSQNVTITLPLTSPGGTHALKKHHNKLKVQLRVGFIPKAKNGASFTSYKTVTFH